MLFAIRREGSCLRYFMLHMQWLSFVLFPGTSGAHLLNGHAANGWLTNGNGHHAQNGVSGCAVGKRAYDDESIPSFKRTRVNGKLFISASDRSASLHQLLCITYLVKDKSCCLVDFFALRVSFWRRNNLQTYGCIRLIVMLFFLILWMYHSI